jgi:hypothetical protein
MPLVTGAVRQHYWNLIEQMKSLVAGEGKQTIHDIDNPAWDGQFPYDPATKFPADPVIVVAARS